MPDARDTFAELANALSGIDSKAPKEIEPRHADRFAIHRNNVVHSRVETLRSIFPVVEKLVGTRFFAGLAKAYIERHPLTSPILSKQGEAFAEFIAGFAPAASVPYLTDIARIEWLRLQAYHAEDAIPLPISALAQVSKDRLPGLVIGVHPSLGLVQSNWPVFSIWGDSTGLDPETQVDMSEPQAVAIVRPRLTVETYLLPTDGYAFLAKLADGAALGQAAQAAAELVAEFDLSHHLQALFEIGAVISLDPG